MFKQNQNEVSTFEIVKTLCYQDIFAKNKTKIQILLHIKKNDVRKYTTTRIVCSVYLCEEKKI